MQSDHNATGGQVAALVFLIIVGVGVIIAIAHYRATWQERMVSYQRGTRWKLELAPPVGPAVTVETYATAEACEARRTEEITSAFREKRAIPSIQCAPAASWWIRWWVAVTEKQERDVREKAQKTEDILRAMEAEEEKWRQEARQKAPEPEDILRDYLRQKEKPPTHRYSPETGRIEELRHPLAISAEKKADLYLRGLPADELLVGLAVECEIPDGKSIAELSVDEAQKISDECDAKAEEGIEKYRALEASEKEEILNRARIRLKALEFQ
jgi:hypothetical protein